MASCDTDKFMPSLQLHDMGVWMRVICDAIIDLYGEGGDLPPCPKCGCTNHEITLGAVGSEGFRSGKTYCSHGEVGWIIQCSGCSHRGVSGTPSGAAKAWKEK